MNLEEDKRKKERKKKEGLSKGHRNNPERAPNSKRWNNLSTNNYGIGL